MNYLEIINKCLTELNYKNITQFSELVKNEHKKIKNIINVLNSEICISENWPFLIQKQTVELPAGQGSFNNPILGKIAHLKIGNNTLKYINDFESFFTNSQPTNSYTILNDTILVPQFAQDKTVEIYYYTNNSVISKDGNLKKTFEFADDETLIPAAFAEPLLIYGTCLRLKGNPQHIRFSFWLSMYNTALANMRAFYKSTIHETPKIKLNRN